MKIPYAGFDPTEPPHWGGSRHRDRFGYAASPRPSNIIRAWDAGFDTVSIADMFRITEDKAERIVWAERERRR